MKRRTPQAGGASPAGRLERGFAAEGRSVFQFGAEASTHLEVVLKRRPTDEELAIYTAGYATGARDARGETGMHRW